MSKLLYLVISCAVLSLSACTNKKEPTPALDHNQAGNSPTLKTVDSDVQEVTVIDLQPTTFSYEISSNGRVYSKERIDMYFQTTGLISKIYVKNGQHVVKGQKLASLDTYKLQNRLDKDSSALASANLEMQDVIIGQGFDPEHLDKVPEDVLKLARLRSGMEQAELALAATKRELEEATLIAPISGVIANLSQRHHNISSSSEPLCRIINDSSMDVEFSVLESELSMVRPGDKITVTPFSGGDTYQGRVTEINPMVDENGMVKVWASVDNCKGLLDGMNVRVIVKREVAESLVVPKSAVVLRSGRQVVFTLDGDKAIWNYVTTSLQNLSEYTVIEGLQSGMTVITSGNINLSHESPVKVIK